MMSNSELRAAARETLSGKWGIAAVATLIYVAISGLNAIPMVGGVLALLIVTPIGFSFSQAFLKFSRGDEEILGNMFSCFKEYGRALGTAVLVAVFTFLWSLLLIVPGIIKSYAYRMSYFIALDHPELGANDCINKSIEMMRGNKGKLFLLDLSFIGWGFLCILSLGIGFLWLFPYMQTSYAKFYEDLRDNQGTETAAIAE